MTIPNQNTSNTYPNQHNKDLSSKTVEKQSARKESAQKEFLILGIESSCDESALSLLRITLPSANQSDANTPNHCSNTHTQISNLPSHIKIETELIATHNLKEYSGVVPESASRQHFFFLPNMLKQLMHTNIQKDSGKEMSKDFKDSEKDLYTVLNNHTNTDPQTSTNMNKDMPPNIAHTHASEQTTQSSNDIDANYMDANPADSNNIHSNRHSKQNSSTTITNSLENIDAICYTAGPGLIGGLMLGSTLAKSLAVSLNKPLYDTNHIIGHALSPMIENPTLRFPYCCLLVSGGHTLLLEVHNWNQIKILASTQDDAMGELFDKVASYLGFGFPGGKIISEHALHGKVIHHFKLPKFSNKKPHSHLFKSDAFKSDPLQSNTFQSDAFESVAYKTNTDTSNPNQSNTNTSNIDKSKTNPSTPNEIYEEMDYFSFSGLKTGFIRLIDNIKAEKLAKGEPEELTLEEKQDICATLQDVVCRICIQKLGAHMSDENITNSTLNDSSTNHSFTNSAKPTPTIHNKAITQYAIVGGVASNQQIRQTCKELAQMHNKEIFFPSIKLCTDNASMIAWAGFFKHLEAIQIADHYNQNDFPSQDYRLTKDVYSTLSVDKNNFIIDK